MVFISTVRESIPPFRKTIIIRDADDETVAVVIPNMLSSLPHLWDSIVPQLQNAWSGEFQWETSNRKDYSYYCWHGDW